MRKASKTIWTTSSSIIIKKLERQTLIDYCIVITQNVQPAEKAFQATRTTTLQKFSPQKWVSLKTLWVCYVNMWK